MKKILLTLLGILIFASFSYTQNRSITFETGKWQAIKEKAKKENKIIFVDCYTSWCGPCKWMAKNIFTNDTVADFFNQNFICAKFDMEKDEGLVIAKEYGIKAYPTFIFVDGDGKLLHRGCGSQPKKSFLELASSALNPEKQLMKLDEQFNNGKREASFILLYLRALDAGCANTTKVKEEYFKTQNESDLTSGMNWKIFFQFDDSYTSREFKYFLSHKEDFAKLYTMDSVNMKINSTIDNELYKVTYKDKTGKAFDEFIKEIESYNLPNYEEIKLKGKMNKAVVKGDWKEYGDIASIYIEKYKMNDPYTLNEVAWKFYEKVSNKALLEKAVLWSKQSVYLNPSSAYYDTYACLTFKLGKKEEAIRLEEQALKLAKENGESTSDYEKQLEEFKK